MAEGGLKVAENRASRDHKFAAGSEILAHLRARGGKERHGCTTRLDKVFVRTYTRTREEKEGEHINSLRGIRIGPFQTSAGWRSGKGVA